MALDNTIKKILKSINTETRQIIQAVLEGEMTGPEIAAKIRELAGDGLAPTDSNVIQTCKKLAETGALGTRVDENRSGVGTKYYFSTKDEMYKALATLALTVAAENSLSFSKIFGCSASLDQYQSNNVLYAYKVLLNLEDGDTYNSLAEKTGIAKKNVWSAIERLADAGLVEIGEPDPEIKYFKSSLKTVNVEKQRQKLVERIDSITQKTRPFTVNEIYAVLGSEGYTIERIRNCMNSLARNMHLIRIDDRQSSLKLTLLGENICGFISQMDLLLCGRITIKEVYRSAGEINAAVVQNALRTYRANTT